MGQGIAIALDHFGPKLRGVLLGVLTFDPERIPHVLRKTVREAYEPPILALIVSPKRSPPGGKGLPLYYRSTPEPGADYSMIPSSVISVMDPEGRFITAIFITHQSNTQENR